MNEDDLKATLINPIYAVSIHPDLAGPHEALVSKQRWVDANERLIVEIGAGEWLSRLLEVLEGGYPTATQRTERDCEPL